MTSPVVVPVSGAQNNMLMSGDTRCFRKVMRTFSEIDKVANVFEDFRTQINSMNLQHPYHSVIPQVLTMLQTTVDSDSLEETQQRELAEELRETVETIMPWEKFMQFSSSSSGLS